MRGDVLVVGGTVVDGTGAAGYEADVRVRDGVITEIGPGLATEGEQVIDAAGALVTPGWIETHTHVDGAMWWDPGLSPLPSYGVTTVVWGNCGMSVAPLQGAQKDDVVDLFCFLEDLPPEVFQQEIPWDKWSDWPSYAEALTDQPTAANVAGYVGHISLRTWVMGEAAWEREATPEEIAQMARVLDASLAAGAAGMSTNCFDRDKRQRDVPSRLANDAEFDALFQVLGAHSGATFQCITMFNDADAMIADARRFARLATPHGVRGQWTAVPGPVEQADHRAAAVAAHQQLLDEGNDFWVTVPFRPLELFFNFERSLTFQRVQAWHDMINGPHDEKMVKLTDPAWRDQARHDWEHREKKRMVRVDRPHTLFFAISETGHGPLDISLADYADELGVHVSDALATWLVNNGLESSLRALPDPFADEELAELFKGPNTITNINDSGAHLQLFCGPGQSVHLITNFVLAKGLLSLEEAVHQVTGRLAEFFGFADRGVIEVGRAGDLAVFAVDDLHLAPEEKVFDLPGGHWRFTRGPGGFRATIVAGVPTFIDGAATEALPGRLVRPS
jgi:N-acyl-D-aspartate/D-glutamate deacylase